VFIGWLCLLLLLPVVVQAQVLNQRVGELLSNNCALLLQGAGSGVLGPQLAATCTGGPGATGAGASGGGGAAAVQTAAASILNRNLLAHLEELRDEEEGGKKTKSASLINNPFGMLAPGMFRGFNMASPTNPGSEGSGAMFNTATQSRWNGLGFFATGLVEALNRDITTYQDGYKSTILGFTAGTDYRFNRQTIAGITVNYANTQGDFDSGGAFNTNSIGTTLFASYLPTDRSFVQVTGGYTRNNYLVSRLATAFVQGVAPGPSRTLSGYASSNSDADVFSLSAIAGYDHPIGRWTVGPRLGLNYNNTHIGDFAENGSSGLELKYNDQWVNSLQSVLGVQAQAAFSTNFGVLVPQFNADYIHEFANSQRALNVAFVQDNRTNPFRFTFQNDPPDRNFFNLGLGLIAVLRNGLQPWVHFRAMTGNSQFQDYAGTFGLRVEM
jgi:uncharacterized protein YhjY with autotransporter beta-barrel domain